MSETSQLWGDAKADEYHRRIWPYLDHLEAVQGYRREQNELFLALYGDREARGLGNRLLLRPSRDGYRLTYNVIKAVADTAQAKIGQHRTLPFQLTENGNWLQWQKGQKLNRFNEGVFYDTGYFKKAQAQFLDATIAGTGFLYPHDAETERDRPGRIAIERVFFDEVKIDDALALDGEPPEEHRVKLVSRSAYAKRYAKGSAKYKAIMTVESAKIGRSARTPHADDQIEVAVTWRFASRDDGNDGLEIHTIRNCTLEVLPWRHDYSAMVAFRWSKQPRGFFGRGIASQLVGMQYEINTMLRVISKSLRLVGVPRILLPTGSNVNPELFTDEIGSIIPHAPNMAPTIMAQQILPPEVYQWFRDKVRESYEIVGINELTATGRKPAGLDSGAALQTYSDMQGERFAIVEQAWEDNSIETAKRCAALARDIAREKGDYMLSTHYSEGFERMSWKKDIDLGADEIIYKAWPQNLFSKTPTAKLQQARDLYNDGIITREQFALINDYPDLKAVMSVSNAATEAVFRVAALIMEKDKYEAPESFLNLEQAVVIMHGLLLKYKAMNAPEKRLDKMRTWIAQAKVELDKAKAAAKAEAAMMQAPPGQGALPAPGGSAAAPAPMPEAPPAEIAMPA